MRVLDVPRDDAPADVGRFLERSAPWGTTVRGVGPAARIDGDDAAKRGLLRGLEIKLIAVRSR